MPSYNLQINGKQSKFDVAADTRLCGCSGPSCLVGPNSAAELPSVEHTVLLEGNAVRSCMLPVSAISHQSYNHRRMSENGDHPLQVAWDEVAWPSAVIARRAKYDGGRIVETKPTYRQEIEDAMHGIFVVAEHTIVYVKR